MVKLGQILQFLEKMRKKKKWQWQILPAVDTPLAALGREDRTLPWAAALGLKARSNASAVTQPSISTGRFCCPGGEMGGTDPQQAGHEHQSGATTALAAQGAQARCFPHPDVFPLVLSASSPQGPFPIHTQLTERNHLDFPNPPLVSFHPEFNLLIQLSFFLFLSLIIITFSTKPLHAHLLSQLVIPWFSATAHFSVWRREK